MNTTFLDDIVKDLGDKLTAEQRAAVDTLRTNPDFSQKLTEGALRQSDYSKAQNDLKQKLEKVQTYYNDLRAAEERLDKRSEALGSDPDKVDPDNQSNNGPKGLTAEDLETRLNDLQSRAASVITSSNRLSIDYFRRFGDVLDMDALYKDAIETNIGIDEAYRRLIEPRVKEADEAALTERIKQERDDAVAEFRKNSNFPAAAFRSPKPGPADLVNMEADQRPKLGWKAAVEAYAESQK